MADSSQKSLVGELNAQKAVIADRIEHVDLTNRDQLSGKTVFIAQHVEHVNITNITRGIDELPLATRYDSRVQNFLEYYLGAKDHPAPFGGGASDLAALDAWLDDPAAPASPRVGQPCAVQPKELSLKNCRQRCGPLHAPSGHNFSKPFTPLDSLGQGQLSRRMALSNGVKRCSPSLPSKAASQPCAKPPVLLSIPPSGGLRATKIKREKRKGAKEREAESDAESWQRCKAHKILFHARDRSLNFSI